MTRKSLRSGYTTGACAAAAVKGAAQMLRDRELIAEAVINLPVGETVHFPLRGQELLENAATCFVVKDAGDDPDVTNGAEIHAKVAIEFLTPRRIIIEGGRGIGRVTKPGLAVAVGELAINPVPRGMILQAVKEVFAMRCLPFTLTVTLSIPDGEERARKTLNERLGIIGGLSILGTTGIVKPISAKAWTDTIDTAIDVARACGSETVVLSTGRTSELAVQCFFGTEKTGTGDQGPGTGNKTGTGDQGPGTGKHLFFDSRVPSPESRVPVLPEAFVMMGDHVGYALRSCAGKGVREVIIAGQFAKLLKIACGHEQTHVDSSELDLKKLAEWLLLEPRTSELEPLARSANTARQVLESSANNRELIQLVCNRAGESAQSMAPGPAIKVFLAGYHGEMLYFA